MPITIFFTLPKDDPPAGIRYSFLRAIGSNYQTDSMDDNQHCAMNITSNNNLIT